MNALARLARMDSKEKEMKFVKEAKGEKIVLDDSSDNDGGEDDRG